MPLKTLNARRPDPVKQFSVFTAHRIGQLHDLARLFSQQHVNILGLTIVDNTDSAIIRCVVDDPDRARQLMDDAGFPYTESDVVVTEVNSTEELREAIAALMSAEININYLYTFIPHPRGKSIMAFSLEDNDLAEQVLAQHQFAILRQTDISR